MLTTRKALLLSVPALAVLAAFFLAPLATTFIGSLREGGTWSIGRYVAVLSQRSFRVALIRSLKLGALVTAIAALVSYPAAYAISKLDRTKRTLLMSLIILPLMTNPVARTYAWFVVMGRHGIINQALLSLELIDRPVKILYTEGAIAVGLLQLFLPLMLLSLVSALENVPGELEEAARSLGANGLRAFRRVLLPLSADGLVIGGTLVFTGSITAYVTPAILGGTRVLMLSTLLYQKAMTLMDWEGATVVAVVMLFLAVGLNALLRRLRPREAA
ncbi:ABC transporter permease [Candidatus Acetothermia bacterium]|nr:MAG: ABC transporter permease [Candidatus Acetothermia bacterium]HDC92141.1 ABC transporter permease [Candidatus Acetothermia bacterium]HDN19571.1 ABC transporter permease [Candidatus Acetothermia bacterium]